MSATRFDVVVAGAGVGGVSAAVAAARTGARVLLVEARDSVGGTGVHSPLGLISRFWDAGGRPITRGLLQEYLPRVFEEFDPRRSHTVYDACELAEGYRRTIAAEPTLTVVAGTRVTGVKREGDRLNAVDLKGERHGSVAAEVFIDGTADGNLSALADVPWQMGRDADGGMQPATLTFQVGNIDRTGFDEPVASFRRYDDWGRARQELTRFMQARAHAGPTAARDNVLFFPTPDDRSLIFNQTRVLGVDPTDPSSIERARREAERQLHAFFDMLKQHPAFREANLESISPMLGVREGRRIVGDYVLTRDDVLGEARFDDMIAACAHMIDIHSPSDGTTEIHQIPGTGYYHLPYRSLRPQGVANLLVGSRCISGTHEAHASYRVIPSICAVGQAAGVAAGLMVQSNTPDARALPPRRIQDELQRQGQFVELA